MPREQPNGNVSPQYSNREPLLRWGGLYAFKNGNGCAGNINLSRVDPISGQSFGQTLLAQIIECLEGGNPLRIVIFENNFEDARSSHTISSTKGYTRDQIQARDQAPAKQEEIAEPVPRPMHRGAPRL